MTDTNPLSGDPMCVQSETEWAEDMLVRLYAASESLRTTLWNEMTDDERDMISELHGNNERRSA